jgi:Fic-DOC domain mobile mystery protein B
MGLNLEYTEGQTPIDAEEQLGLRIKTIVTQAELNEFEQQNIELAIEWTLQNRFTVDQILTETFLQKSHKKMFGNVWKWAGKFRTTNKNLGVDRLQIRLHLRQLLEDCKYWIANHTFTEDEIAIRFKHRLVSIHLFSNGNGRHSRLIADLLIKALGKEEFTWGSNDLTPDGDIRRSYINAIRNADAGDCESLLKFART